MHYIPLFFSHLPLCFIQTQSMALHVDGHAWSTPTGVGGILPSPTNLFASSCGPAGAQLVGGAGVGLQVGGGGGGPGGVGGEEDEEVVELHLTGMCLCWGSMLLYVCMYCMCHGMHTHIVSLCGGGRLVIHAPCIHACITCIHHMHCVCTLRWHKHTQVNHQWMPSCRSWCNLTAV